MSGESPDFGSVAVIQGPPLLGPVALGALLGAAFSTLLAATDLSGFAGVFVTVGGSAAGNVAIELEWSQDLPSGNVVIGQDFISIPSLANGGAALPGTARWFPARGQKLSVSAKGSASGTFAGLITVIPTTSVYSGKCLTPWYGEQPAPPNGPGIIMGINQVVGAGGTVTVVASKQWWGPCLITWDGTFTAPSNIAVKSFSLADQQIFTASFSVNGAFTQGLQVILPAACYHKLVCFNAGAAGLNPQITVMGDLS